MKIPAQGQPQSTTSDRTPASAGVARTSAGETSGDFVDNRPDSAAIRQMAAIAAASLRTGPSPALAVPAKPALQRKTANHGANVAVAPAAGAMPEVAQLNSLGVDGTQTVVRLVGGASVRRKESNGFEGKVVRGAPAGARTNDHSRLISRAATKVFDIPFIAGHMLNYHLGGTPADDNITAITAAQNAQHHNKIERIAKQHHGAKDLIYKTRITRRANFKSDKGSATNLAAEMVGSVKEDGAGGKELVPDTTIALGPPGGGQEVKESVQDSMVRGVLQNLSQDFEQYITDADREELYELAGAGNQKGLVAWLKAAMVKQAAFKKQQQDELAERRHALNRLLARSGGRQTRKAKMEQRELDAKRDKKDAIVKERRRSARAATLDKKRARADKKAQ